ncbi:MAG: class I SAM-dependent methyltransferase [Planctomycetota bacterium]|jgi:SAM-dependent methyltransferase
MFSRERMSFDTVPDLYDQVRPEYPVELVDTVLGALPPRPRILEVGAGTGKGTRAYVERGCELVCVEPGANMAEVLRRNFPDLPVHVCDFEGYEPEGAFDALVSAQAWHWVDPATGYAKAAKLLGPGGLLALYWNMFPRGGQDDFTKSIQDLYAKYAPSMTGQHYLRSIEQRIEERVAEIEGSGVFEGLKVHRFAWDMHLDEETYVKMLETYSDHRALEPAMREKLHGALAQRVREWGGEVVRPYVAVLYTARAR